MHKFGSCYSRLIAPIVLLNSVWFTASIAQADIVSDLLGNQLLCAIAERELADMQIEPLYQVVNGQCEAVVPDDDAGAWFSDDQCVAPITFSHTSMQSYCASASNRAELGNGLGILNDSWTLNPGNRFDLGARSIEGLSQPYMQRLIYRQVNTSRGRCDLEMRIYKKHPTITNQRSMIALHGGSWSGRSFGYLGLELSVPHFVEQGFVVYSPFYRLLDDTDSSAACNQAQFNEIVADGDAALDWVLDNASRFGSNGLPVVFGQSAGGHLALSLAVSRPSSVSAAVLMYPPTDFSDFLQRVQSGAYTNPQGLSVLERVFGVPPNQVSLDLPLIGQNSFPNRVVSEGGVLPPMFIVQGSADELVEARQSVRLCDALAGRVLSVDEEAGQANELRDVLMCGDQSEPASQLHLIKLGEHALDVCANSNIPDLCFSGGAASRSLVSQSVGEAVSFAVTLHEASVKKLEVAENSVEENTTTDVVTSVSTTSGSGGGAFGIVGLVVLLLVVRRRDRQLTT